MITSPQSDDQPVTFDPTSPDLNGPRYWDSVAQLQRRGPLVWVESGGGFWVATSYQMVLEMVQDWRAFSSAEGMAYRRANTEQLPYIMPIDFDPPIHTVYRKNVNPFLTPKKMAVHEDAIRAIADELIDPFINQGSCDIVVDFARKFPGTVFFRLIVHTGDEDFRSVEPTARVMTFATDQEERAQAGVVLRGWAKKMLANRTNDGSVHDVVDGIQRLGDGGNTFADHEYQSGLAILAQGGIGTSANAISAAMRIMAEDRALQQRVRDDLSLVPALVEETLRLEPPLPVTFRTVTRDLEIDGKQLKRGQKVALLFGAANRDPSVFDHAGPV